MATESFVFDCKLVAAITIYAASRMEAEKALAVVLDCADTNFGMGPTGAPVTGEVTLIGKLAFAADLDKPCKRQCVHLSKEYNALLKDGWSVHSVINDFATMVRS